MKWKGHKFEQKFDIYEMKNLAKLEVDSKRKNLEAWTKH